MFKNSVAVGRVTSHFYIRKKTCAPKTPVVRRFRRSSHWKVSVPIYLYSICSDINETTPKM